jgi:hypothetical protein
MLAPAAAQQRRWAKTCQSFVYEWLESSHTLLEERLGKPRYIQLLARATGNPQLLVS